MHSLKLFGSSKHTAKGAVIALTAVLLGAGAVVVSTDDSANAVSDAPVRLLSFTPNNLTKVGDRLFFTADDGTNGEELWVSDGTVSGTNMVKNLNTASSTGSYIGGLNAVGESVFFSADDGTGQKLWKSDGTDSGTVLVANVDIETSVKFAQIGSTVFMNARAPSGYELWKTDGTSAGTLRVKQILPSGESYPRNLTVMGSALYFRASDATGQSFWRSDGTESGTTKVSSVAPENLFSTGSALFFSGNDGTSGYELWKSDGTTLGTTRLKDIRAGSGSSNSSPSRFASVGSTVFFRANDGTNGTELWKTDGTEIGTEMIEIRAGSDSSSPIHLTSLAGKLVFRATNDGVSNSLWLSNGSSSGTQRLKTVSVREDTLFATIDDTVFFTANDGATGNELWKSDGTENGTQRVSDIVTGSSGSTPEQLTPVAGKLFFKADSALYVLTVTVPISSGGSGSSSGSAVAAPIVAPEAVVTPRTIRQPTIRQATDEKPARLLGRSLDKDVLFIADSAKLSPAAKKSLRQAARLATASDGKVAVTGFAAMSGRGSAYEKSVAQKRALAVARYLRAQGFDDWIYYQGLSGRQGLVFEGNPRRVEIRILK